MQTLTMDQIDVVSGAGGATDVGEIGGDTTAIGGGLTGIGTLLGDGAAATIIGAAGAGFLLVGGIILLGVGGYEAYKYF